MIFMVADERRDMKPYAIPVRALPFKSITDAKVRQLRDELKLEMENLGMVVVGLFSLPHYIYIYIYICMNKVFICWKTILFHYKLQLALSSHKSSQLAPKPFLIGRIDYNPSVI